MKNVSFCDGQFIRFYIKKCSPEYSVENQWNQDCFNKIAYVVWNEDFEVVIL